VAPIHRDFHARQVFLSRTKVWVVDWDLFAHGDPALDVANVCVYFETHVTRDPSGAAASALEGYVRAAGDGVVERLPAFRALTYLRLASKAFRLQRPGWRLRLDAMLDRAERAF
jgi:aminoglycoside phosphotransferase (APT) family kinase protein